MNVRILKGQCHEIFDFWFFSWISFPQASEYIITAISNFFENSRRYSRLKVHHRCQRHRWQMEKQKSFNNFVWASLGSRVNIYINFCLQVYFKGTVSRDFLLLVFFHESVSPQLQSIPFRPFRIFSKIRGDIRESRCTTGIKDTGGKIFHHFR